MVRILSQDRLWVAVVLDRRGSGFQIRWLWVSDRCGCVFRLVAVGFRSDDCGFQIEFQVVGLGFDGFCVGVCVCFKHLMYVCVPHWLGMNLVTSL